MNCQVLASPHCACDIVTAEQLSGAHLTQPSIGYPVCKKLDFENADIDGMPTRAVETVDEIATTMDTSMMKDLSSVLRDRSRNVAAAPEMGRRSLGIVQNGPLSTLSGRGESGR